MALQPLRKPHIVQIRDLPEESDGYTVFVKVLAIARQYETYRKGAAVPAVEVKVGDETGSALALFSGRDTEITKEGNVVCIRNGVKKYFNNRFLLALDDFGRVTLQQINIDGINPHDVSMNVAARQQKQPGRKGENKRRKQFSKASKPNYGGDYGQDRDRPGHQDHQPYPHDRSQPAIYASYQTSTSKKNNSGKDQRYQKDRANHSRDWDDHGSSRQEVPAHQIKEKKKKKYVEKAHIEDRPYFTQKPKKEEKRVWTKLAEVSPGEDGLNISVKILSIRVVDGHRPMLKCQVGDDTGVSEAKLDDEQFVRVGAVVNLLNAEAQVVYEHIELRSEKMEASDHGIRQIERSFNLSAKAWVPKAN